MSGRNKYQCDRPDCNSSFSRKWNLLRHKQRFHSDNYSESCMLCQKVFTENQKLQEHLLLDHGPSEKFLLNASAFDQTVVKYRLTFEDDELNFNNAQNKILDEIVRTIRYEAAKKTMVKVNLVYICQMSMQNLDGEKAEITLIPFRSSSFVSNGLRNSSLLSKIRKAFRQQEASMEDFCDSGSNWRFDRAVAYDIELAGIRPLVVGARVRKESKDGKHSHNLRLKKYLFDPDNTDDKCFLHCLHFMLRNGKSFSNWEKELNLKGIKFPIEIRQIKKFVRQNSNLNIRVNVLYRNLFKNIFPLECGIGTGDRVINLLLVEKSFDEEESQYSVRHFMAIKNVDKFLAAGYHNYETSKTSYRNWKFCVHCLNRFHSAKSLADHERLCYSKRVTLEELPFPGQTIDFYHHEYKHMQNFIGFLDFECLLSPNSQSKRCVDCKSTRCKCDKSFTELVNHQDPFAYSFLILNSENQIIHEKTYVGENAAEHFINHLVECWDNWITKLLFVSKDMVFSSKDAKLYGESPNCYLCKRDFEIYDLTKTRDHDHFTGKFLGAACTFCNLQRRRQRRIPIFLHNGSKYDFHFIIRALNHKKIKDINILPYNGEHFRTIEIKGFKFLDSLAFLQASLSQLSEDLSKTSHSYDILKQTFLCKTRDVFDNEKFEILLKKSYYPYEYCTDLDVMKSTKKLPKIKDFYSSLREESISKDEYRIAKDVWRIFKCEDLIDYTKVYCKLDTILLAEIFQKFRKDMFNFSGLDPSHYISLPSFAFDSMLKITKCKLELMNDIDMIQLIESSIRGGVSYINTRHLEVAEKDPGEIVYIDANVRIFY
jgi:hypothetical protein